VREEIHELDNEEIAEVIDELAIVISDDMAAPRTAETLTEAAKRLREAR
jgi:hypothetical protein